MTKSYARSTSPSSEKRRMIMTFSSGNLSQANRTGAVASPSLRSVAAGFPSSCAQREARGEEARGAGSGKREEGRGRGKVRRDEKQAEREETQTC